MKSTFTNKNINLETKKRILKRYVWSTLYYGVETWTVTITLEKRLEAIEMRSSYRKMLEFSWTEKITNEEVLQRTDEKTSIDQHNEGNETKIFWAFDTAK